MTQAAVDGDLLLEATNGVSLAEWKAPVESLYICSAYSRKLQSTAGAGLPSKQNPRLSHKYVAVPFFVLRFADQSSFRIHHDGEVQEEQSTIPGPT